MQHHATFTMLPLVGRRHERSQESPLAACLRRHAARPVQHYADFVTSPAPRLQDGARRKG
jgi:hypothetical protein